MIFGSDNWAGAAPQISEALARHSSGFAVAYGDSELDEQITELFCEIFETRCEVFYVATGTAANSLALAACMKPGGVGFCHAEAHLTVSEGGGPEYLSGGRLVPVGGNDNKMSAGALAKMVAEYPATFNHLGQGVMVSLTQTTEGGTCYSLDEIAAISAIAREYDLTLHMDGARFANALVHLGCSPAEMTWKRGVDIVSFGGTKNGCWCAEALVVFDPAQAEKLKFLRKCMGHLFSKSRFISAQFEAYFQDGLWLDLARRSNAIGCQLAGVIRNSNKARLVWEGDTNQVFFVASKKDAEQWQQAGAMFLPFPTPAELNGALLEDEQVYRLVASFASTGEQVEQFKSVISE